jgi:hypothetical protein
LSGAHASANNWTPTNFATYDQVLDSPTNNFCTWNPLTVRLFGSNFGSMTWSLGNLSANGVSLQATTGSIGVTTGKWYCECTFTYSSLGGNFNYAGEFGLVDSVGNYWSESLFGTRMLWFHRKVAQLEVLCAKKIAEQLVNYFDKLLVSDLAKDVGAHLALLPKRDPRLLKRRTRPGIFN